MERLSGFPARSDVAVVGRDHPDGIEIPKDSISQSRTQIVDEEDRFWVWDLNSTNETFVNGRRTGKHVLGDGDRDGIGREVPVYHETREDRR